MEPAGSSRTISPQSVGVVQAGLAQCAAFSVQRSAFSVQRAACSVQRAACSVQGPSVAPTPGTRHLYSVLGTRYSVPFRPCHPAVNYSRIKWQEYPPGCFRR